MKNAHERFGVLEYTKRMKDTTTRIRLRLDRFIGEVDDAKNGKAHLISVLGTDSDVGAIWAAVIEQNPITVEAPGIEPVTASLGEDAQCFRGTINIAGRKPIRHLVAISIELAKTRPGADLGGRRTVLCDNDPTLRNGPVRWSMDNGFFRIKQNDLEEESCRETSEETSGMAETASGA